MPMPVLLGKSVSSTGLGARVAAVGAVVLAWIPTGADTSATTVFGFQAVAIPVPLLIFASFPVPFPAPETLPVPIAEPARFRGIAGGGGAGSRLSWAGIWLAGVESSRGGG